MKILIFIIILLILCIFNYYITNNEHYQNDNKSSLFNSVLQNCRERLDTNPEDLKYGMGDIFVKLSLLNQDNIISNVCN